MERKAYKPMEKIDNVIKAQVLNQALPYIQQYNGDYRT